MVVHPLLKKLGKEGWAIDPGDFDQHFRLIDLEETQDAIVDVAKMSNAIDEGLFERLGKGVGTVRRQKGYGKRPNWNPTTEMG